MRRARLLAAVLLAAAPVVATGPPASGDAGSEPAWEATVVTAPGGMSDRGLLFHDGRPRLLSTRADGGAPRPVRFAACDADCLRPESWRALTLEPDVHAVAGGMVVDAQGKFHLAYTGYFSTGPRLVYGTCAADCLSIGSWHRVVVAEAPTFSTIGSSLAVDPAGRPRLAYTIREGSHSRLLYGRCDDACTEGSRWSSVELRSRTADASFSAGVGVPSLALDGDRPRMIVTSHGPGDPYRLWYAECDDACLDPDRWQYVNPVTQEMWPGANYALAAQGDTVAMAVPGHPFAGSGQYAGLWYAACTAGCLDADAWTWTRVREEADLPRLALSGGFPHLGHMVWDDNGQPWYAYSGCLVDCDEASNRTTQVLARAGGAAGISIAADAEGPGVAYQSAAADVVYAAPLPRSPAEGPPATGGDGGVVEEEDAPADPGGPPSGTAEEPAGAAPSGQPGTEPATQPEPAGDPQPATEPDPAANTQPDPAPGPEPAQSPEPDAAPNPEPAPATAPGPQPEAGSQPAADPSAQPEASPSRQPAPDPQPAPTPQPAPAAQPAPAPQSAPQPAPAPAPQSAPAAQPASAPQPSPQAQPASSGQAAPQAQPQPQPAPSGQAAPQAQAQAQAQPHAQPQSSPQPQASSRLEVAPTGQPAAGASLQPSAPAALAPAPPSVLPDDEPAVASALAAPLPAAAAPRPPLAAWAALALGAFATTAMAAASAALVAPHRRTPSPAIAHRRLHP
jgi:hypothetical protein